MSSDDQFTALGSAGGTPVGFLTHATHIDRGADVSGISLGVRGTGQVGVEGRGTGGPGGVFSSPDLHAQVRLEPRDSTREPQLNAVKPTQYVNEEIFKDLPVRATEGDLYVTRYPVHDVVPPARGRCVLWLCVSTPSGRPAQWAQVLLGQPIEGGGISL